MRSQLINLMLELQEKQGISYIYVTQHLGMMKHISDQVLVMHQGEVVERGSTADVLASPLHDLTKRLIAGHFGEALTADARDAVEKWPRGNARNRQHCLAGRAVSLARQYRHAGKRRSVLPFSRR